MKEEFLTSKSFKAMLPIIIVAIAIAIWRNGYQFGQWLHDVFH
ncbi:MAG: hypothetical protein V4658_13965 [Bacteroidota bacterium]